MTASRIKKRNAIGKFLYNYLEEDIQELFPSNFLRLYHIAFQILVGIRLLGNVRVKIPLVFYQVIFFSGIIVV